VSRYEVGRFAAAVAGVLLLALILLGALIVAGGCA